MGKKKASSKGRAQGTSTQIKQDRCITVAVEGSCLFEEFEDKFFSDDMDDCLALLVTARAAAETSLNLGIICNNKTWFQHFPL
jgi:hypothetical protein